MKPFLFICVGGVCLTAVSVWAFVAGARLQEQCTLPTHQYNLKLQQVADRKKQYEQDLQEALEKHPGAPVAVVDTTEYDFGLMNPFTKGTRQFTIRNGGDGVLELGDGGKTCHCVEFRILNPILAPGESSDILIGWDTRYGTDEFRHGATVRTSDPNNPHIKFRVNGMVRVELGSHPEGFHFSRVVPDQPQLQKVLIYSQIWEDFQIISSQVTMGGAELNISSASAEELAALEAKSGYAVEFVIPDNLRSGDFQGEWVQLKVVSSSGGQQEHDLELPVSGHVIRRLNVYDQDRPVKSVDFGDIKGRRGAKKRLIMRLIDDQPELNVKKITVDPPEVQVRVLPVSGRGPAKSNGVYVIEVEIPPDGKGVYRPDDPGSIRIEFDHPRVQELELGLTFHVIKIALQPH